MDKLNAEQNRALALFLREHARLMRDLSAARGLLKVCQDKKACPLDYERDLEDIKKTPAYQNLAQGLDLIAASLEQSAEEIDLKELLQRLPKGEPSN